ncbi:hypothetical protein HDK90DRAFT_465413 [Phyllosticta capitalensis]|uniref:Uncharacterized protein n=1 Tax=Phyllosticta capitalensis TaxID=121624 RepID=A0ABR1YVC3_9PEZI
MVACTPMFCPIFKRTARALGYRPSTSASRSGPHSHSRSLEDFGGGRHSWLTHSVSGRSSRAGRKKANGSSISLPLFHFPRHVPHPHLRVPHIKSDGEQSRPVRPPPPRNVFSSTQVPQTSRFEHLETSQVPTRPQLRSFNSRRDSWAQSRAYRSQSLSDTPSADLFDRPFFISAEAEPGPAASSATPPDTQSRFTLPPPEEVSESLSSSTAPPGSVDPSKNEPTLFKSTSRCRSKSKAADDARPPAASRTAVKEEATSNDKEQDYAERWKRDIEIERAATEAKSRQVLGLDDTGEDVGAKERLDDWLGSLWSWRRGEPGDVEEPPEANSRDGVDVADYAAAPVSKEEQRDKNAVVGPSPFNLARRFSLFPTLSNGSGGRGTPTRQKEGEGTTVEEPGRGPNNNGRGKHSSTNTGVQDDRVRRNSSPAVTGTTTTTITSGSSPAPSRRSVSPSSSPPPPPPPPPHAPAVSVPVSDPTVPPSTQSQSQPSARPSQQQHPKPPRRRPLLFHRNKSDPGGGGAANYHPPIKKLNAKANANAPSPPAPRGPVARAPTFSFPYAYRFPPDSPSPISEISSGPAAAAGPHVGWLPVREDCGDESGTGTAGIGIGIVKTVGWSVRRGSGHDELDGDGLDVDVDAAQRGGGVGGGGVRHGRAFRRRDSAGVRVGAGVWDVVDAVDGVDVDGSAEEMAQGVGGYCGCGDAPRCLSLSRSTRASTSTSTSMPAASASASASGFSRLAPAPSSRSRRRGGDIADSAGW